MELTIIGSGTASLQANRGPAGYVLSIGDTLCILDSGTGTFLKCLQAGFSYRDVNKLFYTHLHPDHTIGSRSFSVCNKIHARLWQKKGPGNLWSARV